MANRPSPNWQYIPLIVLAFWGLYATYHLLQQPEKSIDLKDSQKRSSATNKVNTSHIGGVQKGQPRPRPPAAEEKTRWVFLKSKTHSFFLTQNIMGI